MNQVRFKSDNVRIDYRSDGTALFHAKDVTVCLGFSDPEKEVTSSRRPRKEKRFVVDKRGRGSSASFIPIENLYGLALASPDQKRASEFLVWLREEAQPVIDRDLSKKVYLTTTSDGAPKFKFKPAEVAAFFGEKTNWLINELVLSGFVYRTAYKGSGCYKKWISEGIFEPFEYSFRIKNGKVVTKRSFYITTEGFAIVANLIRTAKGKKPISRTAAIAMAIKLSKQQQERRDAEWRSLR